MVADVGGAAQGTSTYDRLKFEAILHGERQMGIAVHNVGASEAMLGANYLRDLARQRNVPFVSCNVRDESGELLVEPYRVVSVAGQQLLFLGVLAEKFSVPDVTIDPPLSSLLDAMKTAAVDVDSIVVLAYVDEEELLELAASLPEVDVIVGGPTGQSIAPRSMGPTLVAAATNKGKFVVRLEQTGTPTSFRWDGQVVAVDEQFEDEPVQQENLRRFYEQLAQLDLTPDQTSFVSPLPESAAQRYRVAGSESCRECHEAACGPWDDSRHALAWNSLQEVGAHVDSYCQQCHTTGYGLPDGFQSVAFSRQRVHVGCESCHGPSSAHAADPEIRTAYFGQAANRCVDCHDRENSPEFVYQPYWEQIAHGHADVTSASGDLPRTRQEAD